MGGGRMGGLAVVVVVVVGIGIGMMMMMLSRNDDDDVERGIGMMSMMEALKDRLGMWAIPAYVSLHTLTLALCLPSAVFFEAGASLLFGFIPGVACVFSAKLLAASLSFSIGRLVFRSSKSAMEWAQRNKYFHLLSRGVEQDGWRFVLLARFSPIPSYIINYALAATGVGFVVDFLLPTVIGCLPMILQNTSIGSLAGAAVASASGGSSKSQVWSYLFPILGISSSILISLRVKKYATGMSVAVSCPSEDVTKDKDTVDSWRPLSGCTRAGSKADE